MLVWLIVLHLLLQIPLSHQLLEMEDARRFERDLVERGTASSDPQIRRQTVRALGRLELPDLTPRVIAFLKDPDPQVRAEATLALIHLKATPNWSSFLSSEEDTRVRAALLEAMARQASGNEALLRSALEASPQERTAVLRGLEARVRTSADKQLEQITLEVLRGIAMGDQTPLNRRLSLSILLVARHAEDEFLRSIAGDPDPQVRRLTIAALTSYPEDDPSYLVRYQALRSSSDCEAARVAVRDDSPHVRSLAIRLLAQGCDNALLKGLADSSVDPLIQARAILALATALPDQTPERIEALRDHPHWFVRALLARAAVIARAEGLRKEFLKDPDANVVSEALLHPEEALKALESDHYGLLMTALPLVEDWQDDRLEPALLRLWQGITAAGKATSRDPRKLILRRLHQLSPEALQGLLPSIQRDFDPQIITLAYSLLNRLPPQPATRMATKPLPRPAAFAHLKGSRARVKMQDAGSFVLELFPEEAPVTVLRFVEMAERGYYQGLSFHRIEPNFVIQGGSPGANEYVGTSDFTRDELSARSHLRGTVGVSTRGRDTGDGQIFMNLVDNYRLDHNYTIFARVIEGMEVIDRIQESDRIESIEILQED